MRAVLIVGHGSKATNAVEVLSAVGDALSSYFDNVSVASMQFNDPDIETEVTRLVGLGAKEIIVAPFFLYTGNHVTEDIPKELEALGAKFPGVSFRMTKSLGFDARLVDAMRDRISVALGDAQVGLPVTPEAIEQKSFEKIESLVGDRGYTKVQADIVHRLVHTTGDPAIADQVEMSADAGEAGVKALSDGADIIVDVKMVRSGIPKSGLLSVGGVVHCMIDDPGVAAAAEAQGTTRSAAAMSALSDKMNGAIVAIGNAPTALFEVIKLIDQGIRPALVIGMPVGFVGASESKDELIRAAQGVPFITIKGYRGGSPCAAATVNAILRNCPVRSEV